MSSVTVPPCPASLKAIQHYLKTAAEHDNRDVVVSYWCRLYALQLGLKIDKSSAEAKKILMFLMDWLEKTKSAEKENEAIIHDIPAQAHLENYALKLFLWADSQDRAAVFNKNVVKAFYTSGMIYDVLETFGELTEEVIQNRKYAKWKAAYIHNCLKNGETPMPGPMPDDSEENQEFSVPNFPQPPPNTSDGASSSSGKMSPTIPTVPSFPSVQPVQPVNPVSPSNVTDFSEGSKSGPIAPVTGVALTPEQVIKAQKYCKFALSALNYDDINTAITNLQKALNLLQVGTE